MKYIRVAVIFFLAFHSALFAQTPTLVLQKGHLDAIQRIVFSQDGRSVLTLGRENVAKVWNPFSGKLLAELDGPVSYGRFSPDGKCVLSIGGPETSKSLSAWSPETGQRFYTINNQQTVEYQDMSIPVSPNGKFLAARSAAANETSIHTVADGALYKQLKKAKDPRYGAYQSADFLSDSTILINSRKPVSNSQFLLYHQVCNFLKDSVIAMLTDTFIAKEPGLNLSGLTAYTIMGNTGRYFLSNFFYGETRLWDIAEKKIRWQGTTGKSLCFAPGDIMVIDGNSSITTNDGKKKTANHLQFDVVSGMLQPAPSPRANYYAIPLMTGQDSTSMTIFHIDGRKASVIDVLLQAQSYAFSPDEQYLITTHGYQNGFFNVWDISEPIARKMAGTETNIIDPIFRLHADKFSNRMIYMTSSMYGLQKEGIANKVSVLEGLMNDVQAVDFFNNDKFGILYNFTGFEGKVTIVDNTIPLVVKTLSLERNQVLESDNSNNGNNKEGLAFSDSGTSFTVFSKPLLNSAIKNTVNRSTRQRIIENPEPVFVPFLARKKGNNADTVLLTREAQFGAITRDNKKGIVLRGMNTDQFYFIAEKSGTVAGVFQQPLSDGVISSNGKYIFGLKPAPGKDDYIYCVDFDNKPKFKTPLIFKGVAVAGTDNPIQSVVVSPNGETACISSVLSDCIRVLDANTGTPLQNLKGRGMTYSNDGRYGFTWSDDGTCGKWEIATGRLLYTMLFFFDHDYAVILPNGYYYISSRTDARFLNFKLNGRLYNFSQFDLKYNRPDKVLAAAGNSDTALIREYFMAWQDRVKKSGFSAAQVDAEKGLNVPSLNVQTEAIAPQTKTREQTISFTMSDSLYNLQRYNIFINDVPVNGINGKLLNAPAHAASASQQVLLNEGRNKIEVNCTNENAVESRKEVVYIDYKPAQPVKHTTWFIGIGINQYAAHSSFLDLSYCVKDIRDLSAALKAKLKEDVVIDTLIDFNATKENILALRRKLLQTDVDDKVIISFSGHGMVDPQNANDFYFVTPNTQVSNPAENGVSYAQLEELLDSIPARKKLLLLDACHSGESVAGAAGSAGNIPGAKRGEGQQRGIEIVDLVDQKGPASATDIFKLMKEAFVDIRRNNGAYVLSAAQSNEVAGEGGGISNGWFTSCLIEQIRLKDKMTINELSSLVNKCVNQKSGGNQNTDNRQELAEFNWQLW